MNLTSKIMMYSGIGANVINATSEVVQYINDKRFYDLPIATSIFAVAGFTAIAGAIYGISKEDSDFFKNSEAENLKQEEINKEEINKIRTFY